jgi:hypothetical protein
MAFLLFPLDGFKIFEDVVDAFHFVEVSVLAEAVLQAESVPQVNTKFFGDIRDVPVVVVFHFVISFA